MKEYDLETLAQFDGKDGKPVYIAHQGKVYDVSQSKMWRGGLHMKRHHAGKDLSTDIQAAPHGTEVLERYPLVGVLQEKKKEVAERELPPFLAQLLMQFPFLRRHPHPMTVHFPIVFMMATPFFNILYLLTGNRTFETTGFHCLAAGVVLTPLVIGTGYFSWWLNYLSKPLRAVAIKKTFSVIMWVIAFDAFLWRLASPDVLTSFRLGSVIYFLLVAALAPLVSIIGWYGAKLTFPIERE